jgi:hypothetical protein
MAEPLGEVCSVTGRLLRRGFGFQTSRRVNVFFRPKVGYFFNRPRTVPTYIIKGKGQQILILLEFFYLPTDAQENCFKKNIKIYIKTAPTCHIIHAATPPN